jgi:hypothetical protein
MVFPIPITTYSCLTLHYVAAAHCVDRQVFRSLRTIRFSPSASVSEENAFHPLSPLHPHALFSAITRPRDHSPAMKFISIPFDFVIDRNREERATDLDADAGLAPMSPLSVVSKEFNVRFCVKPPSSCLRRRVHIQLPSVTANPSCNGKLGGWVMSHLMVLPVRSLIH